MILEQRLYFAVTSEQQCEDGMRYIVMVSDVVARWLNANYIKNHDFFFVGIPHSETRVDISEEVLIMMGLRWT